MARPKFRKGAYFRLGNVVLVVESTSWWEGSQSAKLNVLNPPRHMRRSRNFVLVEPHGDVIAGLIDGRRRAFAEWFHRASGYRLPEYPGVYGWDEDGGFGGRIVKCDVSALRPISKREAADLCQTADPSRHPRKAK